MSLRRVLIAVALVCGLCVWGFARSGAEPLAAQGPEPVSHEAEDADDGTRDEALSRFRTNQARHWRQLAVGSSTTH